MKKFTGALTIALAAISFPVQSAVVTVTATGSGDWENYADNTTTPIDVVGT